jgi:hypothetical protein
MKTFPIRLAAAVLVLLVAGYLARNLIARKAVEFAVERQTGFPLEIGAMDLDLVSGRLEVKGLRLLNPPEFPERTFVDLPLLRVDYDTVSLLRRKPHLRSIAVNVRQVFIVTNERGDKNSARLESAAGAPAKQRRSVPYRVDVLRVHVGAVVILDHSHGRHRERKLTLSVDRTYRGVSESTDISGLVLGSVFSELGPVVGRGLGDVLGGAGDDVGEAGKGVLDVFKTKR